MSSQKGREFLLEVEDSPGAGTYTVLGGLTANTYTINNTVVEITDKQDNGIFQALEGAGLTKMSVSGQGRFKADSPFHLMETAALNQAFLNYRIIIPTGGSAKTFTGKWAVTKLDYSGTYDSDVSYSVSLESAGTITAA